MNPPLETTAVTVLLSLMRSPIVSSPSRLWNCRLGDFFSLPFMLCTLKLPVPRPDVLPVMLFSRIVLLGQRYTQILTLFHSFSCDMLRYLLCSMQSVVNVDRFCSNFKLYFKHISYKKIRIRTKYFVPTYRITC